MVPRAAISRELSPNGPPIASSVPGASECLGVLARDRCPQGLRIIYVGNLRYLFVTDCHRRGSLLSRPGPNPGAQARSNLAALPPGVLPGEAASFAGAALQRGGPRPATAAAVEGVIYVMRRLFSTCFYRGVALPGVADTKQPMLAADPPGLAWPAPQGAGIQCTDGGDGLRGPGRRISVILTTL